ncbi:hypothetical protein B0H11DRAFT_1920632 [Mycena galericulata]|nr:hypothetical protein B0H11DRAFT_1920632 [Mycena galericulata]
MSVVFCVVLEYQFFKRATFSAASLFDGLPSPFACGSRDMEWACDIMWRLQADSTILLIRGRGQIGTTIHLEACDIRAKILDRQLQFALEVEVARLSSLFWFRSIFTWWNALGNSNISVGAMFVFCPNNLKLTESTRAWAWAAGLDLVNGFEPGLRKSSLETRLGSGMAWAEQVEPGHYGWLGDAHIRINQSYCIIKPRRVGVELCCSAFVVAINHGDRVSRDILKGVVVEGNTNSVLKVRTCSVAEDKPKPAQAQAIKARTAKFKLRQAGQAV